MERLLRYWEQNKRKILITIAVIALVIIVMQIANTMIKQQNEANANKEIQNTQVAQDITKPNQAVISDTKLNEQQTEDNAKIIEDFVNYCNQKNIDSAYNLLSDECKEEVYRTQEIFETGYINQIFKTEVNYSLELWYTSGNYTTYQITYNQGNLLQTGRTSF